MEMKLVFANTVDYPKCSGENGKRRYWNVIIDFPKEQEKYLVFLEDGKVRNEQKLRWLKEPSMELNEIRLDTDFIVRKAEKEFNIKPGDRTGKPYFYGYHFRLFKEDNIIFFSISGFTQDNKFIQIYYNPKNGKYVGSEKAN